MLQRLKIGFWVAMFLCGTGYGQGIVQNGANIVFSNGSHLIVKGKYEAKGDAIIRSKSVGFLNVDGDFENNGNTTIFRGNRLEVDLSGGTVNIGGNALTNFPNLSLSSSGNISLTNDVMVGGVKGLGSMGKLKINGSKVLLQGRTLIMNNPLSNALTFSQNGHFISESNSSTGYGFIQWNIRQGDGGPIYNIPLANTTGDDLSVNFIINNMGSSLADSGFVKIATYPTPDKAAPNNRPMPIGVFNTDNECDGENSMRLANRYWIIEDNGYATLPDITLEYAYSDVDIQGSNDAITEDFIGLIKWNNSANKWIYPQRGQVDANTNRISYRAKQGFSGIWTLSDTTPYPKAQFNVTGYCQKDSIVFEDASVETIDKIILRQWTFGDGSYGTRKNEVHYYQTAGSFDTKLIIRSQAGCQDTAEKRILVQAAPTAQIFLRDTCENEFVKFDSKSWPGAGFIEDELWDFGINGATATGPSVSYYYGAVGIPEVRLIVYNSKGCKDTMIRPTYIAPKPFAYVQYENDCQGTPIDFTNGSTPGSGTIISHAWNFGNGVRSTQSGSTVTYEEFGPFPIQYVVTNSFGCKDTSNSMLEVYPRAIAQFSYNPDDPKMLTDVSFINESQYSDRWDWDFGDSYYSTDENPKHAFPNHATYQVQLIANTAYNCADTTIQNLTVKSIPLYWFANAFSPGTTEDRNDEFGLVTPLTIHEYKLSVYNRWGQVVFETENPNTKWDGRINGELCPVGQYIYFSSFKSPENEIMTYKGSVLLIR